MTAERYTRLISRVSGILCALSLAAAYIAALRLYPPNAFLGYIPPALKREIMNGVFVALSAFTACRELMELALPVMPRSMALILPIPALLAAVPLIALRFDMMSATTACYAFCAALMLSVPLIAAVSLRLRAKAKGNIAASGRVHAAAIASGIICALLLAASAVLVIYAGFFSSPLAYLFLSPVATAAAAVCIAASGLFIRTALLFAASGCGMLYCIIYPYEQLYPALAALLLALIAISAVFYILAAAKAIAKRGRVCYNNSKSRESCHDIAADSARHNGGITDMESKNKVISGLGAHHFALKVNDFERSYAFYTALGLTPVASWGEGDGRAQMFDIGDGAILEMFAGGGDSLQACGKFQHLAFQCDDIDAAYEKALSVGARPHIPPKDVALDSKPEKMVLHIAFVLGPDDEQLEFFSVKSKG